MNRPIHPSDPLRGHIEKLKRECNWSVQQLQERLKDLNTWEREDLSSPEESNDRGALEIAIQELTEHPVKPGIAAIHPSDPLRGQIEKLKRECNWSLEQLQDRLKYLKNWASEGFANSSEENDIYALKIAVQEMSEKPIEKQ
jgi:predicted nuclease of restriction endonuclease-like (RecB) superfamily